MLRGACWYDLRVRAQSEALTKELAEVVNCAGMCSLEHVGCNTIEVGLIHWLINGGINNSYLVTEVVLPTKRYKTHTRIELGG